jgi:hypothetical protein
MSGWFLVMFWDGKKMLESSENSIEKLTHARADPE